MKAHLGSVYTYGIYTIVCGATILYMFPNLRTALWRPLAWQAYAWQMGRRRQSWDRIPAWRQEGLIVRGLAPRDRAA